MANYLIPDHVRAYLIIEGVKSEITPHVTNWADLAVDMVRDGLSGVFVQVEQPLSVMRDSGSGDLLRSLFLSQALHSRATFEIWKRGDYDFDYTLVTSSELNFATYAESIDTIEISAEKRDFNSLVSSFGRTKYDIPAADISSGTWNYAHNETFAGGDYTMPEAEQTMRTVGVGDGGEAVQAISIHLDSATMPLGGIQNDIKSQEIAWLNAVGAVTSLQSAPDSYFFMVDPGHKGLFKLQFGARFRISWDASQIEQSGGNVVNLVFGYTTPDGVFHEGQRINMVGRSYYDANWPLSQYMLPAGAKLQLFIYFDGLSNGENGYFTFKIENFEFFTIRYVDKSSRTETWNVTTLERMANALLAKMSEDFEQKYTATVDTATFYDRSIMLCAAETIRGYGENANFHVSFADFVTFMQCLGCEWTVDEIAGVVAFHDRRESFDRSAVALDLSEGETTSLMIKADSEHAYSSVKVGYERPEIDNMNGKLAPHGAHEYTLGYQGANLEKQQLEIMSPYKSDPIELEQLSWSASEKDTDTKTDNDVFAVAMTSAVGRYTEYRGFQYRFADYNLTVDYFNAPLNPRFIAEANTDRMGINAKVLKFASTDAYRDVKFTGRDIDPFGDLTAPDGLFLPILYEFEAGTHLGLPLAGVRNGLVLFMWHGVQYQGFIKQLVKNHCFEQSTSWQLYAALPYDDANHTIVFSGNVSEYTEDTREVMFAGSVTETLDPAGEIIFRGPVLEISGEETIAFTGSVSEFYPDDEPAAQIMFGGTVTEYTEDTESVTFSGAVTETTI